MSFKAVLELLPGLKPDELQEVRLKCSALLGSGITTAAIKPKLVQADKDDWYAHAVGRYAVLKGWVIKGQVSVYLSQKALSHTKLADYHERSKQMRGHIEKQLGRSYRQEQLEKVGDVMVASVALRVENFNKWLKEKGEPTLPIDGYALLDRVDNAIEALEEQLPGYLANGMLGLVINSRGGPNVKPNTRVQA